MAMLDITVGSIECKLNNENCSFLGKIKYILKSVALNGMKNNVKALRLSDYMLIFAREFGINIYRSQLGECFLDTFSSFPSLIHYFVLSLQRIAGISLLHRT